ncbi:hypothetical protein DPMN_023043 [Dreissena polymorpha]|uniref:Uncharacterized protein n=1 Tax=Dreissena polymorpha TaxID=45954 RepID=A0A9D4LK02_DREPO|nr:hypothetical protein DPMN_023043 [Dreissena polymorpha]
MKPPPPPSPRQPCYSTDRNHFPTQLSYQGNKCFNVLTKFHKNWAKNVTSRVEKCPAHWQPCFFTNLDHFRFELVRHINKTNVLINLNDDWAKILTSRVFTRKTAPRTGDHLHEDWALNVTSTVFTNFIGTKLLNKFHEDRTINMASSVYKQMLTDGRTTDKDRSQSNQFVSKETQTNGQAIHGDSSVPPLNEDQFKLESVKCKLVLSKTWTN